MANVPALWEPSARKEVYDLLVALWPRLDDDDRVVLVMQIAGGPPAWMSDHLSETDRDQLCARRVFERLRIMQRSDPERPNAALETELARLRGIYPHWDVAPGDQAHFSFYSQSRWRTLDSVDDEVRLQSMTACEIVEEITTGSREDALDDWRQMVASDWDRMMAVLRGVAERTGPDPSSGPRRSGVFELRLRAQYLVRMCLAWSQVWTLSWHLIPALPRPPLTYWSRRRPPRSSPRCRRKAFGGHLMLCCQASLRTTLTRASQMITTGSLSL